MRRVLLLTTVIVFAALPALGADSAAPEIEHEPDAALAPGADLELKVTITDASGVFDPVVLFRIAGATAFSRLSMQPAEGDVFTVKIGAAELAGGSAVEYLIEAYDQEGNGPARLGAEATPLRVPIEALATPASEGEGEGEGELKVQEPLPIDPEPGGGAGVWIGVGIGVTVLALVAAGGVGGYYIFLREDVPAEVRVNISAPSPVAAAP